VTDITVPVDIDNQHCMIHFNGPTAGCGFKGNRGELRCCCDFGNGAGYEVPLLGYNTTTNVFIECDNGIIPTVAQPDDIQLLTSSAGRYVNGSQIGC